MDSFEYGDNPDVNYERPTTLDKLHRKAKRELQKKDNPKINEKDVFDIPKGHPLSKQKPSRRKKR